MTESRISVSHRVLFLLVLLWSGVVTAQQRMEISYAQAVFDSDTCCWRKLASRGHYLEAAALIDTFLASGHPQNRQSLRWHAGQMYAMAGQDTKALKRLHSTYSVLQKWLGGSDGKAWYRFAKGTCAFLRRDRRALDRQIRSWKSSLPPDGNLRELERLQANWELSYKDATHVKP